MATLTLTPPPFPADTNVFYRSMQDSLNGVRSVYSKDRTTVGLKTASITITGSGPAGAIITITKGTFDRPSAFLLQVQADATTGAFSFPVTLERGTNLIQAETGALKSNVVSLNAFNLHLYLEDFGQEFLTEFLPLLERSIADQNIDDTENIISGGLRVPTTTGLRDNLGSLVQFQRPELFSADRYHEILRTILQRIIRRTTTVDAQRELFRAFTDVYPRIDEFYRRSDFLPTSDLNVSAVRPSAGSPAGPTLMAHLNAGFIHIGQHDNLRVIAGDYMVVDNATNYLIADGSHHAESTIAIVYVTAASIIPAFVTIPDTDVGFQYQMRLSFSDRFDGAFGDTGWIPWTAFTFVPVTVTNPFVPLYVKFRTVLGAESEVAVVRAEARIFAKIVAQAGDIVDIQGAQILGDPTGPLSFTIPTHQYSFEVEDVSGSTLPADQKNEATKFVTLAKPAHHRAFVKFADESTARVA